MDNLIELLTHYSISDIAVIGCLLYCLIRAIKDQLKKDKKEKKEELETYHSEISEKEQAARTVESRLASLEKHQAENYESIQGLNDKLEQITEEQQSLGKSFDGLSRAVLELRIEWLRTQMLRFYDRAVDLEKKRPTREAYQEFIRNHTKYMELLDSIGETNGYIDFTYEAVMESMRVREKEKLFAEDIASADNK